MTEQPIRGIHHVTAIATDPQRNLDFYTELLGLRLVKRTINFDDPGTYHFYFGDEIGNPGTILTFFPWLYASRGSVGTGQVATTSFSVPENSLGYWEERLRAAGVPIERGGSRFDEEVLNFADPDGLKLELVAHAGGELSRPWDRSPVEGRHAIRRFFGVTVWERSLLRTAATLATMGFRKVAELENRTRFEVGDGGAGTYIDLLHKPDAPYGQVSGGSVHHVAWRVADEATQLGWRSRLMESDLEVTPVVDRIYFRSVYFREPSGVLFELATDTPGFAIDEPIESLGELLMLPPWLESKRDRIKQALPTIQVRRSKDEDAA